MVRSLKKDVVLLCVFEKGTWLRDGFWRYAHFKNMPIFLGSHVRGRRGGGSLNLVFYGNCRCSSHKDKS